MSFIICLVLMAGIAVRQNHKLLGHELREVQQDSMASEYTLLKNDTVCLSTEKLAKDVTGYGGATPVKIYLKEGRVVKVEPMENEETLGFFELLGEEGLFDKWNGMTPQEAVKAQVDAVSGATFSSEAVIENVRRGMQYVQDAKIIPPPIDYSKLFSPKTIAVVIVILASAILPLFIRSKRYRWVQLLLNVVVLGCWGGSFLSYTLFVNYLSNGISWTAVIPILLLVIAFIYPLFGKSNYYCTWVCPLGSLQEIAGRVNRRWKWSVPLRVAKGLNYFREALWVLLMILMWAGVWTQWMDYELFSAFLFKQASMPVLVMAGLFIVLSFFVNHPYCRFVCPTGTLFRMSQRLHW